MASAAVPGETGTGKYPRAVAGTGVPAPFSACSLSEASRPLPSASFSLVPAELPEDQALVEAGTDKVRVHHRRILKGEEGVVIPAQTVVGIHNPRWAYLQKESALRLKSS